MVMNIIFHFCQEAFMNSTHWTFNFSIQYRKQHVFVELYNS